MKRKLITVLGIVLVMMLAFASPVFAHDGVGGDELAAADSMLIVAGIFVVMSGLGVLWSISNGEFRNPEAAKFNMLKTALYDEDGNDLEKYVTIEDQ
jgi:nitrogen fixation-related uncharacterized protein